MICILSFCAMNRREIDIVMICYLLDFFGGAIDDNDVNLTPRRVYDNHYKNVPKMMTLEPRTPLVRQLHISLRALVDLAQEAKFGGVRNCANAKSTEAIYLLNTSRFNPPSDSGTASISSFNFSYVACSYSA